MNRKAQYPVLDVIISRWSPRAMSGESITHEELMSLFEAARWAASSYNNQPWRFVYVLRDTPGWNNVFQHLVPFNQGWAKNASVLIVAISRKLFALNDKPSRTHALDTGAATANLAIQGHAMGLVVHGMEGFDYEGVTKALNVPNDCEVLAMYVVGKPGPLSVLSPELQEREKPSDRKNFDEFVFQDDFK